VRCIIGIIPRVIDENTLVLIHLIPITFCITGIPDVSWNRIETSV
jgi:hypothetical protein